MTGPIPPTSGSPPSTPPDGPNGKQDVDMPSSDYKITYENVINNPAAEQALDKSIEGAGSRQRASMQNQAEKNKKIEEGQ
ncbi:MAG: hypothetical protein H7A40_05860 [Chlamydiales bacterium]|nr:hypothetical protein [Chlamydiales bacterium]